MTTEDRLIALETRLAHQEQIIEDISDVLTDQSRMIDRLLLQVRRLQERIGDMEAGSPGSPQDEKPPPHY